MVILKFSSLELVFVEFRALTQKTKNPTLYCVPRKHVHTVENTEQKKENYNLKKL